MSKNLEEVDENASTTPCVICLDSLHEPSVAVPCEHANFDFLCLISWLEQRRVCPLCMYVFILESLCLPLHRHPFILLIKETHIIGKAEVTAVKHNLRSSGPSKLYILPTGLPTPAGPAPPRQPSSTDSASFSERRGAQSHRRIPGPTSVDPEDALSRRRHVYRNQLFSLRVGSNRLSRYRELTPQLFNQDEDLTARARTWIRRELQVFEFLNPETAGGRSRERAGRTGELRLARRRANNAEFLLEYIIAILCTVDIKGSAGQAEDLLQEFIGRANARLFLHELQSWLRSPYVSLHDWDRNVQYPDTALRNAVFPETQRGAASPVSRSTLTYPLPQSRIANPRFSSRSQGLPQSHSTHANTRRLHYAMNRYPPD
jgi:RING finger family protein